MKIMSAIISLDGWYRYALNLTCGIPMTIKKQDVDAIEFLETGKVKAEETILPITEEAFNIVGDDDEVLQSDRLIDAFRIIPQDGLRYSIINILAFCIGKLVNDYMAKYCDNANTTNERPCLITMKNEFLFKRCLITDAKKHYASIQELQEGNVVPVESSLDIKGMDAFVKTSVNPAIQAELKKILYEDILNAINIDQIKVLRDIAKVEKQIYDSIMNGEKKFFKPVKVKSLSSYENPMRIQGIVASYAYNALHEPGTESIDMSIRNSVDIVKVDINAKNVDSIKQTYPYVYEKAVELMKTKEFSTGIDAVAIPANEPVPGWILPFVQYHTIINDNVSGFPIASIGFNRGNDYNNSTNIIQF